MPWIGWGHRSAQSNPRGLATHQCQGGNGIIGKNIRDPDMVQTRGLDFLTQPHHIIYRLLGAICTDHRPNTHLSPLQCMNQPRRLTQIEHRRNLTSRCCAATAFIFFAHPYGHTSRPHSEIWTIHVNKRNRRYFGRHWRSWYRFGHSLVESWLQNRYWLTHPRKG